MVRLAWPPQDLAPLEKTLDELAESVRNPPKGRSDDEQIWLTRFLIVRSCGYLEQVLYESTIGHIEYRAGGTARAYALSWLSRSINPSPENVLRTLGRFDAMIADEFQDWLSDNGGELNNELSSLVARRNGIAHGLNEGMGSRRALDLYSVCKLVADWLILRLNPDPSKGSTFTR